MRLSALTVAAVLCAGVASAQAQVDDYQPLPPPPLPTAETSPETPPPAAQPPPATGPAQSPTQAPPLTSAPPPGAPPTSTVNAPGNPPPVKRRMTRITTGPLTTLAGNMAGVSFEFERAMSDRFSLFAGPRLGVWPTFNASVSIGARYFPIASDLAPAGLWLGPESWTNFQTESGSGYSNVDFGEILLAMAGYTVIYPSGWTMSFGAGFGGGFSVKSGTALQTIVDPNGVTRQGVFAVTPFSLIPAMGVQWNVGYAF